MGAREGNREVSREAVKKMLRASGQGFSVAVGSGMAASRWSGPSPSTVLRTGRCLGTRQQEAQGQGDKKIGRGGDPSLADDIRRGVQRRLSCLEGVLSQSYRLQQD